MFDTIVVNMTFAHGTKATGTWFWELLHITLRFYSVRKYGEAALSRKLDSMVKKVSKVKAEGGGGTMIDCATDTFLMGLFCQVPACMQDL